MKSKFGFVVVCLALTGVALAQPAGGVGRIPIDPPGERQFVLDQADLLSPDEEAAIKEIADKLLTDKAAPIIVVTIDSMASHGAEGMRIETFARLLFDQWGIGYERMGEDGSWNYGILLLVSQGDRRARIELGADWRRDKDGEARRIMDTLIVPRFKQGDFGGGIVAGVEALDKMGRDLELPTAPVPPTPAWVYWAWAIFVGLAIFTIVSLARRGSSGWAWLFWGAVFTVVGVILYQMAKSSSSSSSGGGFSGGSFGGGFSGGGGATGSW